MVNFKILLLMSLSFAVVSAQSFNNKLDIYDQHDFSLEKLIKELVESTIKNAVEENNVNIFAEIQMQKHRIAELELRFEK